MAGKIIKEVAKPCKCDGKPPEKSYGAGTEWQCDCGQVWELVMSRDQRDDGAHYWSRKKTPAYTGADR
jgi:hypothetical protein